MTTEDMKIYGEISLVVSYKPCFNRVAIRFFISMFGRSVKTKYAVVNEAPRQIALIYNL